MTKILVVEDDASLRVVIRMVLEREGYEISEAAHGAAAMDHIAGTMPDLVLADMTMPQMNGLELIRRLRSMPGTARLPIVLLTGHAAEDTAEHSANAVVMKPFEPAHLVATVRKLVAAAN